MPSKWSAEHREQALALLRDGAGVREVERRTGVPRSTLSAWAQAAGVQVAGAEQTAAATNGARIRWAHRRAEIADRMGDLIVGLLDGIETTEAPRDKKDLAVTAAVLVEKAQLVSGGATSRGEVLDEQRRRERVAALEDELAQRRAAKDGTTGG